MTMPQPPPLTKDASKSNGVLLDRYSRTFLLSLSGINLVLGLIFYAYPSFIISDWPWPVKELAVRFLGARVLAMEGVCVHSADIRSIVSSDVPSDRMGHSAEGP